MKDFAYLSQDSAIDKCKAELEEYFVNNQISPQNVAKLLIVVDEIVSNIVFYGNVEHGMFTVSAEYKNNDLTLVFKDNGQPFNPLTQDAPDTVSPIKERNVGGLGILIVKKIATSLSYEYRDECNILTFVKSIDK